MKNKPVLPPEPEFNEDGYPTEKTLRLLKKWPYQDARGALEFMRAAWSYPERATAELTTAEKSVVGQEPGYEYFRFSTGGWSGNEDLIGALQENVMVWNLTWQLSARGGLYVFNVSKKKGKSK